MKVTFGHASCCSCSPASAAPSPGLRAAGSRASRASTRPSPAAGSRRITTASASRSYLARGRGLRAGPAHELGYTLRDRSSLGMSHGQQPRARRPAPAVAVSAATRSRRTGRSAPRRCRAMPRASAACRTSASASSAASKQPSSSRAVSGSTLNSRRSCAWPCSTSTTRCSPATATTSGASSWSTAACSTAKRTRRRTARSTSSTRPAPSTSTSSSASRCGRSPTHAPEDLDALARASSCASASGR